MRKKNLQKHMSMYDSIANKDGKSIRQDLGLSRVAKWSTSIKFFFLFKQHTQGVNVKTMEKRFGWIKSAFYEAYN